MFSDETREKHEQKLQIARKAIPNNEEKKRTHIKNQTNSMDHFMEP
jgi:hypothetical protein